MRKSLLKKLLKVSTCLMLVNIHSFVSAVTGTSIGYFSTRANLDSGLRQLQQQKKALSPSSSTADREREMNQLDLRAGSELQHEGGVGGMYQWSDRSHSTRGDH